MSELTDKLKVLNDPTINLVVNEYESVVTKFEISKALLETLLSEEDMRPDALDVALKLVKFDQIKVTTLLKIVTKLYDKNSSKIETIIRDGDSKVVKQLREQYKEHDADGLEAVSDKPIVPNLKSNGR